MKKLALAVLMLALSGAASAQMTLFENDNNRAPLRRAGRGREPRQQRLQRQGVVGAHPPGTWQICDDAYFRGHCVTLQPGEYRSLGSMGLNDSVSSAREIGNWGRSHSRAATGAAARARCCTASRDSAGASSCSTTTSSPT